MSPPRRIKASRQGDNISRKNDQLTGGKSKMATNLRQQDVIAKVESLLGGRGWLVVPIILAAVVGILHSLHISSMFENDRYFSHLSDLEREMTFRTEMGLYYSYYKSLVHAPTFICGLEGIMNDNITEYPHIINVLNRFNLYPEVIIAAGFRIYDGVTKSLGMVTRQCYMVNRGEDLSPVSNCDGMGDLAIFYINMIFIENGAMLAMLFLLATYLSGSLYGGVITVAAFFYNHGECTRVQWTPPLRESVAYPIFVLQMFVITHTLRIHHPGWFHNIAISITTSAFMLAWQFAQFALLTQTLAVSACYILGYTSRNKLRSVLQGQSIGLVSSYILLFGNEMVLLSFFASCLIAIWAILLMGPIWKPRSPHVLITMATEGVTLIVLIISCKLLLAQLLGITDDAHISNLLRSKFSDYKDFHTMLYTCAAEYDFMSLETPIKFMKTLLLPTSLLAFGGTVFHIVRLEYTRYKCQLMSAEGDGNVEQRTKLSDNEEKPHGEIVYHLFQSLAFLVMAVIIMRLKLFLTPHLCLMSSLLASKQIFSLPTQKVRHTLIFALLALMSIAGSSNLRHQWSIQGSFRYPPQEELLNWVNANTSPNSVFAGTMPTMAAIKLSTLRPIVNHPHYEDVQLRERTKIVYQMYSRKPAKEVYEGMVGLHADYVILEQSWCVRRSRPGCSLPEIWDLEDEANRGREPVCLKLQRYPGPYFKEMYHNEVYTVLRIRAQTSYKVPSTPGDRDG